MLLIKKPHKCCTQAKGSIKRIIIPMKSSSSDLVETLTGRFYVNALSFELFTTSQIFYNAIFYSQMSYYNGHLDSAPFLM